jgi:hypothetical protein
VDEAGFTYASDTRGRGPFLPCGAGESFRTVQLPTTTPTLDEVLGLNGMGADDFVDLVREGMQGKTWSVLTLHAELEGIGYQEMAGRLLAGLQEDRVTCVPLEVLAQKVRANGDPIPVAEVVQLPIRGRAGTVAMPAGLAVP